MNENNTLHGNWCGRCEQNKIQNTQIHQIQFTSTCLPVLTFQVNSSSSFGSAHIFLYIYLYRLLWLPSVFCTTQDSPLFFLNSLILRCCWWIRRCFLFAIARCHAGDQSVCLYFMRTWMTIFHAVCYWCYPHRD